MALGDDGGFSVLVHMKSSIMSAVKHQAGWSPVSIARIFASIRKCLNVVVVTVY